MTGWIQTWLGGGSQKVVGDGSHSACHKWSTRGTRSNRDLACLTSLSVTWGGGGVHSHQVCRCHQTGRGTPINTLEGWAAFQRDLARLEEGAARDLMEFSRDKCKVLPWARRNPWGSPGMDWLGAALRKSAWGVANSSLNVSQQRAPAVTTASWALLTATEPGS